jgi:hypothetical protein
MLSGLHPGAHLGAERERSRGKSREEAAAVPFSEVSVRSGGGCQVLHVSSLPFLALLYFPGPASGLMGPIAQVRLSRQSPGRGTLRTQPGWTLLCGFQTPTAASKVVGKQTHLFTIC